MDKKLIAISALLCGSLAILGAGLYLRAMNNNDTSTETTQDMPEELDIESMLIDEDMPGEFDITDEELAKIIAEISAEEGGDELESEGMMLEETTPESTEISEETETMTEPTEMPEQTEPQPIEMENDSITNMDNNQ